MKEIPVEISPQTAITADNVGIEIDGILYIKVVDPYKASYGVDDAICQYMRFFLEIISIAFASRRCYLSARANHHALGNWFNDFGPILEGALGAECKDYSCRE